MKEKFISKNTYLVVETIGSGGMGTVVKVQRLSDGMEFALKYCKVTEENALRRFAREVRIMSETIHPNIVPVLEWDTLHDPPFFVMPIAKVSLHGLIKTIKGDANRIFQLFEEVCKGISAMHNSGKYHRDIKPSNVLIMENGSVMVSDFGLSKEVNPHSLVHSSSDRFLGTPGYDAPEQIQGKNCDARTDVFQLGKTLYELFTRDYPHLIDYTKIPPGLGHIIRKATMYEPFDRYQTVAELLQAINSYRLSLDPTRNPQETFEHALAKAEASARRGEYDHANALALLDTLHQVKDDYEAFLDNFDKIPDNLLKVYAATLSEPFTPILDFYTKNLDLYFSNAPYYPFEYAEEVSSRMDLIFNTTRSIHIKVVCLQNTMIAAIRCNRFSAMNDFNAMLRGVKSGEDASAIAAMLHKDLEWYQHLYIQIPKNQLHYVLQSSWDAARQLQEKESKKRDKERGDWLRNADF